MPDQPAGQMTLGTFSSALEAAVVYARHAEAEAAREATYPSPHAPALLGHARMPRPGRGFGGNVDYTEGGSAAVPGCAHEAAVVPSTYVAKPWLAGPAGVGLGTVPPMATSPAVDHGFGTVMRSARAPNGTAAGAATDALLPLAGIATGAGTAPIPAAGTAAVAAPAVTHSPSAHAPSAPDFSPSSAGFGEVRHASTPDAAPDPAASKQVDLWWSEWAADDEHSEP